MTHVQGLEKTRETRNTMEMLDSRDFPMKAGGYPRPAFLGRVAVKAEEAETPLTFFHTNFMAQLMQERYPLYHTITQNLPDGAVRIEYGAICDQNCTEPCRIEVVAALQWRLGTEICSIVGDYMRGKGWPGCVFGDDCTMCYNTYYYSHGRFVYVDCV